MRVINPAEPELGLGVVLSNSGRRLEVLFPATGDRRVYNRDNAPLRRFLLRAGQEARGSGGVRFRVERVVEREGLLIYQGQGRTLAEAALDHSPPQAGALDRLLQGHLGQREDFELRLEAWRWRSSTLSSPVRGLVGPRVELLPHQLYIAHTVSRMERPRVLLADEVGLGKTIESGLIFCALRSLGRADRLLVLVPEPLIHQWLAEMYRRFNEMLTIIEPWPAHEPRRPVFDMARRALCSIELLTKEPELLEEACVAEWDLLIVDEAHHLRWRADHVSPGYAAVERLSRSSAGLLLLTATPARGGLDTEFGLLRLVDPERFSDLERFRREHRELREIAVLARELACGPRAETAAELVRRFPDLAPEAESVAEGGVDRMLSALVDRHGTGRVLIRNRRQRLESLFPGRQLAPAPLEAPEPFWGGDPLEALFSHFGSADPRLRWLVGLSIGTSEKILLICRRAETAVFLQDELRRLTPARTALFHEQMGLLERDRQAAFFAQPEGAQILLSSEIGGEGRNFQFARHLVFFDIPWHPDLIEQRIGRLDRIGQQQVVTVHVPYLRSSPWELLFRWHHEGLRSFDGPVPGAQLLLDRFSPRLRELVCTCAGSAAPDHAGLARLIRASRKKAQELQTEAAERIDPLVDRNSYDPAAGRELAREIRRAEADPETRKLLGRLLERFGLADEPVDDAGTHQVKAGEMMFVDSVPGLPTEGVLSGTFARELALSREDLAFITREHPLVEGCLSLLLDQPASTAAACLLPEAPESAIVLQCLFVLQARGPARLELERYLPPAVAEGIVDFRGKPRPELRELLLAHSARLLRLSPEVHWELMARIGGALPAAIEVAERQAKEELEPRRAQAMEGAQLVLQAEERRLEQLARVNPNITPAELALRRERTASTLECVASSTLILDAVRLVVLRAD
ncbi:MAG: RNA polymerase-associated protein RapA [Armatimonadetes bacterium]|nr:RNA polymerase-associated protein RapA [Armatimonadota bacterium]